MNSDFSPALFVQSLVAPDTRALADEILSKKKRGKGSKWILDNALSPADLYVYLKARFGPPNGVIMIVRAPHSDNVIQWHYTLKSGSSKFDILGLNTRTEFLISEYRNLGNHEWTELVASIKRDFRRFGPKMKEVRKRLENWRLFYNPYHRIERIVQKYSQELLEITKSNFDLPTEPRPFPLIDSPSEDTLRKDIDDFKAGIQAVSNKYTRAVELSTNLRLICPVWAEAFVNFVIFVLCRDDIKTDHRLYQDFIRKEIDVRVKLLHINCNGFEKAVDANHELYKDFHSLMNERNDLLHGNIDPEKLGYETVYFDGTIPLFTEPQGLARNSLGVSLKGIEPEITLRRVELIRSFIEFILSHLEKSCREELSLILDKRELGWRSDTKRIGVLFSDYVVDAFAS